MATANDLKTAADYFSEELCVPLSGADRPVISSADETMLSNLKTAQSKLDDHVATIKSGAEQIDWPSEAKKQSYLEEVERHHQTLDEGLQQMATDEALPQETQSKLYDAARELKDCANGILEDPAIN